ncbi:MAG: hypothetical protein MI976_20885, partial [Pseudomonadales bacterium]|nr:hypothetical protein [Pseudomonadales bacterium]
MSSYALLIGNGINNISSGPSWSELLEELTQHLAVEVEFTHDKPFPLAYEEIYFKAVKSNQRKESDIKKFIANQADKITFSEVHQALNSLSASHIMTTNYDLSLELAMGASKKSVT